MISIRSLSVELGGTTVLESIDLEVEAGEWTSVIGPNGAGKTTLLRAVTRAVPFAGEIRVGGEKPQSHRQLARTLAYLPQNPVLPIGMHVIDYVLLGRTPYIPYLGTESRSDRRLVEEVLQKVELAGLAHRALGSLSGGELQRAIFARALAQEPKVLLLDEPTTGMDIGHQQRALELVDSLRREQNLTVLAAIHDLTLAGQFSNRLMLIDQGRAYAFGPPEQVLTEELLTRHYRVPVKVVEDGAGGRAVVPTRASY